MPLRIDNTATLHVVGNLTFSSRTKHVGLLLFYIRELVKENKITTHYHRRSINSLTSERSI